MTAQSGGGRQPDMPRRRKTSRLLLTDMDFEIVPYVDTLVLLLMFVVVTTSFRGQPGIKVELPTSAASPMDIPQYTEIAITEDGKLFVANQEIANVAVLGPLLQQRAAASSSKILFVRADRNTRHGIVVAVIDAAKRAGFIDATIATTSAQE